ncbi:MAG TPA: hypothetical protein VMW91_02265 [Desulfosporosinus sp.]|nr:hypothetical protein [Desulfosporosinus sp.]
MFRKEIEDKIEVLQNQLIKLNDEVSYRRKEQERYPDVYVEESIRIIKVKENKGEVIVIGIDLDDGVETEYYLSVSEWELALDDGQIEKVRCGSKRGDILRLMLSRCENHCRYFVAR